MALSRWSATAALIAFAACGSVVAKQQDDAGISDAIDAPSCASGTNCADGYACTAASQCASSHCECRDAVCASKVCSAAACACQYTNAGASCDGNISLGEDDAANTCGASACDGTGACGLPLIWYKLDEPAGSAITNSGTWPGTPTSVAGTLGVPGKIGTAIQLAAATDGITLADPSDGSLDGFTSWTVEGWINLTQLPLNGYATLVKKDVAYICRLVESASCVDCYTSQTAVWAPSLMSNTWQMPAAPVLGTWYHMACSYEAGTVTFYWNGSPMMSLAGSGGAIADTANALAVGKSPANTENLQGYIDDFRLWSTLRTPRQICLDACGTFNGTTCDFDGVCN